MRTVVKMKIRIRIKAKKIFLREGSSLKREEAG
jgi:hypothetical protein